ncbi:MAG: VWA domain-containing protein [Tannerella sp.]|jgi:hypothetical protein|nr:VWA domain-containing protein [Tannerella sp.]
MGNYSKQCSSANPGLLIFMIDQSGSMSGQFFENEDKAEFATKALNNAINQLIERNFSEEQPKNRCHVALIAYGSDAHLVREGSLSELFHSPMGKSHVIKKINAGDGSILEQSRDMPYWIVSKCDGGTNMVGAFRIAQGLIEQYVAARPDTPAPVIISISDGQPNVGGGYEEVAALVRAITQISCDDGAPLVYNAHIEKHGFNCCYPSSAQELPNDEHARFIFDISSQIPSAQIPAARKLGYTVEEGARGCTIGGDAVALVSLILFGSSRALFALPVYE